MSVERSLSSRFSSAKARTRSRVPLLFAAASFVSLGCDDETRCWENGTCADITSHPDASVDTASTSEDRSSSDGHAASSEPSSSEQPTSSIDEPTVSSEPSSSSSAPDTDVPASCRNDDQCADVCVEGLCQACDPADHRGCEDAEAGRRCRVIEDEYACVECLPGDTPPDRAEPCGINDRGQATFECVAGVWQTTGCEDPDVCRDGETQVGETSCGPNDRGHYLVKCDEGQWVDDTTSCIDDDQCVNGTRRDSTTECGFSGYLEQQCVNGAWLTQSNRCNECRRKYHVPDPLFEAALSVRNNIPADPVDPDSVKYIYTLNLSFSSVADATGIQCFTSLGELDLGKNQLTDLTPLASLTGLRRLNLSYNILDKANSLAPLAGLTELRFLALEGVGLISLEGLETLTLLEELRAPSNYIRDVSPLLPLTELQLLALYGNYDIDCESEAFATLAARVPEFSHDCE